jgi:hypothetical protein
MYLCVMETFLEYDKKTFDMVIHDTQERILKQIYERRLEEFKMRMEYLNIELRMEMGGDRGGNMEPKRYDISRPLEQRSNYSMRI